MHMHTCIYICDIYICIYVYICIVYIHTYRCAYIYACIKYIYGGVYLVSVDYMYTNQPPG